MPRFYYSNFVTRKFAQIICGNDCLSMNEYESYSKHSMRAHRHTRVTFDIQMLPLILIGVACMRVCARACTRYDLIIPLLQIFHIYVYDYDSVCIWPISFSNQMILPKQTLTHFD